VLVGGAVPGEGAVLAGSPVLADALGPWRAVPLAAQAALYAGFGGYLAVLRTRRPGAPCGCFSDARPASWPLAARAALLAAGSLAELPHRLPPLALLGGMVVAVAARTIPTHTTSHPPPDRLGG
jgi:hypothetical protein